MSISFSFDNNPLSAFNINNCYDDFIVLKFLFFSPFEDEEEG